jgi:hypothetical protein
VSRHQQQHRRLQRHGGETAGQVRGSPQQREPGARPDADVGERQQEKADARREQPRIPEFLHDVADYMSAGFAAHLELRTLEEWRDAGAPRTSVSRLLSMTWRNVRRLTEALP